MNGTLVETGPKMDWTRDNKIFDRYLLWKDKVEKYFCSILADVLHNRRQDILDPGWVIKAYHSSRNGFVQTR